MNNILLDSRRKLQEWFERVDQELQENFEVISNLLVPKVHDSEGN